MKFFAILKDSLREALDTKVFYVMVGFSLLVILLIGSIGYRPVSVEEDAHRFTDQMTWFLERFRDPKNPSAPPRLDIKDFEQTKPGAPPWDTGYRFALTLEFEEEQQAKHAHRVQNGSVADIQQMLKGHLHYLKNLKASVAEPRNPKEVRFVVTTEANEALRVVDWPHYPVFVFVLPLRLWKMPLNAFVLVWESYLINWIGAGVALLISTIITAFFIPNMLNKGTVDLLIVKPISRPALLLSKYIGGLLFMFLNTVVVVVGIWLVLGLRTNIWGTGFLLSIFVLTFQFALYYAVSTLFAVLSRSPIVAILMTCLFWFVFVCVIGYPYYHLSIDKKRRGGDFMEVQAEGEGKNPPAKEQMPEKPFPDAVYTTADIIHFVTPHLKDLDTLTDKWIIEDVTPPDSSERKMAEKAYAGFRWTEAITVTSIYMAAFLAVSCWWFARKDY